LTRYTLPQHEVDTYVRAVDPNRGIAARIKRWRQRRREHWPRITPPTVPPKAPPTFTNDD
jgi:hypothetical protein